MISLVTDNNHTYITYWTTKLDAYSRSSTACECGLEKYVWIYAEIGRLVVEKGGIYGILNLKCYKLCQEPYLHSVW
jgi:hypothetical protein